MRLVFAVLMVLLPATAEAQWAFSAFTGTSKTHASDVTVDRPEAGQAVAFEDVRFDARPFHAAPYYGVRVTRFFGDTRRFGLEFELLHNKVYARTGEMVRMRGIEAGVPVNAIVRMDSRVQRHNQSHGLTFLLASAVWRRPLGASDSRVALLLRGGAGPVVSGRDIVMTGLNVQGYEVSGLGAQAAAGFTARISGAISAMAEYKFTYARPGLDLTGGGRTAMTAASHHIALGLTVGR